MQSLQTEILIVGGGSTGTGVLRDAAMRGFRTILVEKRRLNEGTTGRYHGLLHSGGRYAVTDPEAARECIEENRILRRIMPHAIDPSDGFFVLLPQDDPDFVDRWLVGCREAGIPVDEVPLKNMLKEEPALNPAIKQCFRVPDAASYAAVATEATVASAREYGSQVLINHEVVGLLQDERGQVVGALCRDTARGEDVSIHADMVINAAGAVSNKIAALAGIRFDIVPGKGTMVAVEHLPLGTVINRLRMPADGDIIVPLYGDAVVGTTDVRIENPEDFRIEMREIDQMLQAGEDMMPGFSRASAFRAWAGVRPLQPFGETGGGNRGITRGYSLLDHASRDGVSGLVTITGGKWTTHRLMAEVTLDLVCERLDTQRPCRTSEEVLPEVQLEKTVVPAPVKDRR